MSLNNFTYKIIKNPYRKLKLNTANIYMDIVSNIQDFFLKFPFMAQQPIVFNLRRDIFIENIWLLLQFMK